KKCIKCRICEKECPSMAINIDSYSVARNCISCGHCVAVCPKQAVMYNNTPVKKLKANTVSSKDLINLYKHNRSVRFFRDRPVPEKIIKELMDAVKYYASASNRRKTSITVITDRAKIKQLNDIVSSDLIDTMSLLSGPVINFFAGLFLGKKRSRLFKGYYYYFTRKKQQNENFVCFNAPVLFLFHSKASSGSIEAVDSVIWAANTSNLAAASGIGSLFVGYITMVINRRKFRKIRTQFGIPSGNRLHAVLAAGYPSNKFVNEIDRIETEYTIL
ncbi:MAG: nitroreductase family protein, partial [Spirochaetes bacterium]|nr:nitroreductase family protein [Spirochaetota bacterium]